MSIHCGLGHDAADGLPRCTHHPTLTLDQMGPAPVREDAVDRLALKDYLGQIQMKALRPGQVVVLDNLKVTVYRADDAPRYVIAAEIDQQLVSPTT